MFKFMTKIKSPFVLVLMLVFSTFAWASAQALDSAAMQVSAESVAVKNQNWLTTAQVEARVDWLHHRIAGEKDDESSGFRGQYLNLILKGELGANFYYAYRQRFSKGMFSDGLFSGTDWLYVGYKIKGWEISAGKLSVGIGGFEYDYAPIDVYQYSEYCNNINCYQFGASLAYRFQNEDESDHLEFQFTQSPFRRSDIVPKMTDLYGMSLKWNGTHKFFTSLWSVNMFEAAPISVPNLDTSELARKRWIYYIALGNRFDVCKWFFAVLDYTHRYTPGIGSKFFSDFTFSTELHFAPTKMLNLFAIYSYDRNRDNTRDFCVFPGTEQHHAGAFVEFLPIRNSNALRIHAGYFYTWGQNTNPEGIWRDKEGSINIGVTFRGNLLKLKK